MGKTLFDSETEDINGSKLNRSILRQRGIQNRSEISLDDSRTDSEGNCQRNMCHKKKLYPESAKPSVFPMSSSIFTFEGTLMVRFVDADSEDL